MRIGAVSLLLGLSLAGCAHHGGLERVYHNPWERDIGYAGSVRVGNRLIISGVVAEGATLEDQMRAAYAEIGTILAKSGCDNRCIISETIYTRDMEALKAAIPVRKAILGDAFPASTWVQVERLFMEDHLIEIQVEAVVGN